MGCNTGNGEKLSSSQAQLGQTTCLAVALFLSISCVTSSVAALYVSLVCIISLAMERKMYALDKDKAEHD